MKPKKVKKTTEQKQLEKEVEDYLVKRVKECGLDERKMNPQMCSGIPDRLVFAPKGDVMHQFVELKRPVGGVTSGLQGYLARGLNTLFVNTKSEVEYLLAMYFTKYYVKPQKDDIIK